MSDLIQRLRDYTKNLGGNPEDYLTWQAADRIQDLEAQLQRAKDINKGLKALIATQAKAK